MCIRDSAQTLQEILHPELKVEPKPDADGIIREPGKAPVSVSYTHLDVYKRQWLLPIIAIQIASIAVCYVAQYHAADDYFPDYMVGLMAVLLPVSYTHLHPDTS